jgi:hypothetical protein
VDKNHRCYFHCKKGFVGSYLKNVVLLNELDANSGERKNLTLFMPCRKKMHSTSSFLIMTFGLIILNIEPTSWDFSNLANHKLWKFLSLASTSKYKALLHNWYIKIKGHFILQPLVKNTKDSSNLIDPEQKFVMWAFLLEDNGKKTAPSKTLTWQHFLWVLAPRVWHMGQSVSTTLIKIQSILDRTKFSFQTYTNSSICIF